MAEIAVDKILKEFAAVKARRAPWEPVWELIARYMYQRKQGFTNITLPGSFYQHNDVFDNTAGQALQTMISSMDGALWKNGARTFRYGAPRQARNTKENKDFYTEVNARSIYHMEHEKAAFGTARIESFSEGAAFGTDALGIFAAPQGSEHKIEYRALSLRNLYIVEDAKGRVVKEFYEIEYTASQLIDEYGDEARTDKVKALLEANNHDTKIKVVWVIRPRTDFVKGSDGDTRYSYESIHIMQEEKKVVRNQGFHGNPIVVSRFYKNEGEEYGRCPGYNAINPTIELNALIELFTKGGELLALPSWYVLDDGTFGNGVIDRSPGGVIPIDVTSSKITGMAPIGQIGTVGDMTPLLKLIEYLIDEINKHFYVDKLTDLNNQTRMTLGEAQIRNELRADNVGSVYSRQIEEKLTPTIRRSQTILEEAGELGVEEGSELHVMLVAEGKKPLLIPAELLALRKQGIEIYQIEYVSPASRILRSEELRGVISMWQFAAGFAGVTQELVMRLDKKRTMEMLRDFYGVANDLLLSDEEYEAELQAMQAAQQAQMQMQMALAQAEISTKQASANQQNAQAQATTGGMNGLVNGGGAGYAGLIQ